MNYDELELDFDRDWNDADVKPFITDNGSTLRALEELHISKPEIDALEHRAAAEHISFKAVVRSTFQKGLQHA